MIASKKSKHFILCPLCNLMLGNFLYLGPLRSNAAFILAVSQSTGDQGTKMTNAQGQITKILNILAAIIFWPSGIDRDFLFKTKLDQNDNQPGKQMSNRFGYLCGKFLAFDPIQRGQILDTLIGFSQPLSPYGPKYDLGFRRHDMAFLLMSQFEGLSIEVRCHGCHHYDAIHWKASVSSKCDFQKLFTKF